jgi:GxxExxY protein
VNRRELRVRTGAVVDSAIRVHTVLGPGLLEATYEACLAHELRRRGFDVRTQVPLPVFYEGLELELGYRLDLLVDESVVVELKAVHRLLPIHRAQLLSYLKLNDYRVGLLINFHSVALTNGIIRLVNNW